MKEFTAHPFYGKQRIFHFLRTMGEDVNIKRVARLMRQMGLEATYPKPNLSRPEIWSKKYPYLLRSVDIIRPDQVWASDITYIHLRKGFVYLVVVLMDWFSRYVLSNSLEADFCVEAGSYSVRQEISTILYLEGLLYQLSPKQRHSSESRGPSP